MPQMNREQRRAATKKKDDEGRVLIVPLGGVTYKLRDNDYSAWDELLFEQATGKSLSSVFTGEVEPGMAVIAGLVWLHRLGTEPKLTYREVAENFRFSDLANVQVSVDGKVYGLEGEVDNDQPTEEAVDPTPAAGS